jgi:hypothetical protein
MRGRFPVTSAAEAAPKRVDVFRPEQDASGQEVFFAAA